MFRWLFLMLALVAPRAFAGPGTLAIPFARRVASVTAVEPAEGMVSVLKEKMVEEGVSDIDVVQKRWEDVSVALHISAYSLKALADAFVPLMTAGGSFVGLDFDNTVAWPAYNWMGVAKSALESVSRYLAKELGPKGIRSNLVAAGPVKTMAAKSIPGFKKFEDVWDDRAPLGWDVTDSSAVAKACVALLSDWFPSTTGEVVHVDGGYHATGA